MNLSTLESNKIGYEQAIRDLAYGTILLHQHRYDDAYASFTALEALLTAVGLRRELLRVKLRLAACQLARQKMAEVMDRLKEITSILQSQSSHEPLILSELSWHSELYQLVKTHPVLAQLWTLLSIEQPSISGAENISLPIEASKTEIVGTRRDSGLPLSVVTLQTSTNRCSLRIEAFGEAAVFLDEQLITRWRMARAMELFFFLLNRGQSMRKEQIVATLWPEEDE